MISPYQFGGNLKILGSSPSLLIGVRPLAALQIQASVMPGRGRAFSAPALAAICPRPGRFGGK